MLKNILIIVAIAVMMAIGFYLLDIPARADGYYDPFSYHTTIRHRMSYRKRHHREIRLYADPRNDDSGGPQKQFCLGPVRGVGTQWIGENGAMDAAKKDWAERVRYDHGESFIDLTHAESFEKRCGRTSIGEVVGQVLYRCEIIARPCKAEFEKEEGQR